ncbi:MAG TPA: hypothetical protein VHB21_03765, partial [Minicystis sp.]|nr:hypothetical protein [Minicystis sp.]
ERAGRSAPAVVAVHPAAAADDPTSIPGFDALARDVERGAFVVATADLIHHGAGYGTPGPDRRADCDGATLAWARETVDAQLDRLASGDFAGAAALGARVRSDFVDAGPVFAALAAGRAPRRLRAIRLVDYADVLGAPPPTWVAAAFAASS